MGTANTVTRWGTWEIVLSVTENEIEKIHLIKREDLHISLLSRQYMEVRFTII